MHDIITLADPVESCETATGIADRIESLALVLAAALESPRAAEIKAAAPDVLALIRGEVRDLRGHIAEVARTISDRFEP